MNGPNLSQIARDRKADVGLTEGGDDIGTGDGALHHEEVTAG